MLPSWLELVRLSIHPDGIDGVVVRRGDHKILRRERLAIPMTSRHAPWSRHLEALPDFLSSMNAGGRDTRIVVSNALVHFLVHPWQEALGSDEEWQGFSRHAFTNLYGTNAGTWRIRLAMQGYGQPVIACAMDDTIAESIMQASAAAGARISGLTPHFSAAFNRHRKQFRRDDAWLAQIEPGRLCLGKIEQGSLVQIVTRRVDAGTDESPDLVLKRELERCAVGNDKARIFFQAAGKLGMPENRLGEYFMLPPVPSAPPGDVGLSMALC